MQFPPKHRISEQGHRAGYSLIELVTVLAITIGLLAFLVPAVGDLGRAKSLTIEGNRLDMLIGLARQTSLSSNGLTALVMNTQPGSPGNLRSFSLWELRRSGPTPNAWTQMTRWETFREGIAVYPADNAGWENSGTLNANFPPMSSAGRAIDSFQYRIFQPIGNLAGENPLRIRLVEGSVNAQSEVILQRGISGSPSNTFEITILPGSGKTKVTRY